MANTANVSNNNGRCRIRVRCPVTNDDLQKSFGRFDNPQDKHDAQGVCLKINQAILNNDWSGDIGDYLPEGVESGPKPLLTLLQAKYEKNPSAPLKALINKLEGKKELRTKGAVKKFIGDMNLKASSTNRYRAEISSVRPDLVETTKARRETKKNPKPFQETQRDAILKHFEGTQYEHYVWTLFKTGMRPSELLALTLKDFVKQGEHYHIEINKNINKGVLKLQTKDKRDRILPLTEADWLKAREPYLENENLYRGFHHANFRRRSWTKALNQIGIDYLPPYNARHTAISGYLMNGHTGIEAARIFGNSPRIIDERYANIIRRPKPV